MASFSSDYFSALDFKTCFSSGLVSTSGQLSASSEEIDKGRETRTSPLAGHDASVSTNSVVGTTMHAAGASQQSRANAAVTTVTNTSADWTAQLKNDLGIGGTAPATKSSANHSGLMSKSSLQNTKAGQVPRAASRHTTHSNTVEFVSGEANGPTLPEYQFGFHVDSATGSDEHADDVYSASAKSRPLNNHTAKVVCLSFVFCKIIGLGVWISPHCPHLFIIYITLYVNIVVKFLKEYKF